MSLRSAVRGVVLVAAGAAVAASVAALLSPGARRAALSLVARASQPEPEQPTHIVLPDRAPRDDDGELAEAIEEGRSAVPGDVALTGS